MKKELTTPADLSEASYEYAITQLQSMMKTKYPHRFLKVSLWDVDEAIRILAIFKNFEINITRYYRADEWSVFATDYETKEVNEVYSPGA